MRKLAVGVWIISLVLGVVPWVFAATLTSLTLEMSDNNGAWTNAPGGIWSTNTGDPLTQLGVMQDGTFLNLPINNFDLGEISIALSPGLNTFDLFGTSYTGSSDFYGLALYFDNNTTPADMAVYNSNGSPFQFMVTPEGTRISGSANGGVMPDEAPGSSVIHLGDGSTVELQSFNVFYATGNPDVVSWGNVEGDEYPDTIARISLNYKPVPIPSALFLIGSGLIGLMGLRKFSKIR